jgi:hypothetical protein
VRSDAIEIFSAGLDIPDEHLVLGEFVLRKGIVVSNSIQCVVRVDRRESQKERPTDMRLERAGGNEDAPGLQSP